MNGVFDRYDNWNDITDCTAVPLASLQTLWEQDKVYTQNHFSRDYVIIYCLFQQIKVDSYRYIMTAFSPKAWLTAYNTELASSDELQTYKFELEDNTTNIDIANRLQILTPVFIKCKLDAIRSTGVVAFCDAEILLDYKTPSEDLILLPQIEKKLANSKNINDFVKLISSFTNWDKDECMAFYYNTNILKQSAAIGASNIQTTIKHKSDELNTLTQGQSRQTASSSTPKTFKEVFEVIIGLIIIIFILKTCIGGTDKELSSTNDSNLYNDTLSQTEFSEVISDWENVSLLNSKNTILSATLPDELIGKLDSQENPITAEYDVFTEYSTDTWGFTLYARMRDIGEPIENEWLHQKIDSSYNGTAADFIFNLTVEEYYDSYILPSYKEMGCSPRQKISTQEINGTSWYIAKYTKPLTFKSDLELSMTIYFHMDEYAYTTVITSSTYWVPQITSNEKRTVKDWVRDIPNSFTVQHNSETTNIPVNSTETIETTPYQNTQLIVSTNNIIVDGIATIQASTSPINAGSIGCEWNDDDIMVFLEENSEYIDIGIIGIKEGTTTLKVYIEEDPSIYQIVTVSVAEIPAG
ncbi:MAG: hypothetical protein IKV66_11255 [Clostridia bacterium]|nr:hypothetical protein [Clostridia bacterium]